MFFLNYWSGLGEMWCFDIDVKILKFGEFNYLIVCVFCCVSCDNFNVVVFVFFVGIEVIYLWGYWLWISGVFEDLKMFDDELLNLVIYVEVVLLEEVEIYFMKLVDEFGLCLFFESFVVMNVVEGFWVSLVFVDFDIG